MNRYKFLITILILITVFLTGVILIYSHSRSRLAIELNNTVEELDKAKSQLKNNRPITINRTIYKSYRGFYPKHLRNIIDKTLIYLDVKHRTAWNKLLYLTVLVESDNGALTKQIGGTAKSVFQIEPKTERETLDWLKAKKPILYEKIKNLRIPAKLEVHEGEYNIAYATALAYSVYLWRKANPINKSDLELAQIHKKLYNTYLGKGSVERSMKILKNMDTKL